MYKTVCLHGIAFLISLGLGIFLISSLSFSEPSISAARIDEYLRGKHSPLAEHGSIFIDNGIEFDVDPRLVIAIAGAETTFGTNIGSGAKTTL